MSSCFVFFLDTLRCFSRGEWPPQEDHSSIPPPQVCSMAARTLVRISPSHLNPQGDLLASTFGIKPLIVVCSLSRAFLANADFRSHPKRPMVLDTPQTRPLSWRISLVFS